MAAGNVSRVLRAPGRIIINPATSFSSGTFPYGGTEVGKTNACVLASLGSMFRVEYEGLGEAGDILEADKRFVFSCIVRGWDDDAIQLLRPEGYAEGSVTRHSTYSEPGIAIPGESALNRAVTLAYVPDDTLNVPGLIIYRGVPDWTDGSQIAFQRQTELGLPISLECMRSSGGKILTIGRIEDLSLS